MSLRSRLLAAIFSVFLTVGAIAITFTYADARRSIQEVFDTELAHSAQVLFAVILPQLEYSSIQKIQTELNQISEFSNTPINLLNNTNIHQHQYDHRLAFQFIDRNGNTLLQSENAPDSAMVEIQRKFNYIGFADTYFNDSDWRVFSLWDKSNHYLVQIAERIDTRNELANSFSKQLIVPIAISLFFLGIITWFAINKSLEPIKLLVYQVTRREARKLEPLQTKKVPTELQPLVNVLNDLFLRLTEAFEKERRFTDDAAHELRTPLAALKVQAQVAMRENTTEGKDVALSKVLIGVDRNTHLLEQLLTLARLDTAKQDTYRIVNLVTIIESIISDLSDHATKKTVTLKFVPPENTKFKLVANPYHLSIMFRNILENAINYSPSYSFVLIDLSLQAEYVVLNVEDNGPGIDETLVPRLFDRFYRAPGNEIAGCGLGLSIVKQIADLYAIDVSLFAK
ncbi:MAG: ATP-binding protein, partial [Thiohalomonadales bacterium]